ncbi:MAG: hypothetical protein EB149_07085 [Thaumarchaeota archaeon]|nr:hypothetical protein [Nitrososphaerota archaeon]
MEIKPIFGEFNTHVNDKLCFVLMPFTKKLSELFEDNIKKIVERNGLECIRADNIYDVRPIMADIWDSICKAKIIISDLTDKNPNVFYETGIAHTVGKTTILLTQNMNDVPFDLKHLRIIVYEFTPRGVVKLENDLDLMIKKLLSKEGDQLHIQTKESTEAQTKVGTTIPLWDENGIKPAGQNYLVYTISVKKGYELEGTITSNDIFALRLLNEKNKEKFENNMVTEAIASTVDVLRYNIHYKVMESEKLYLMLSTKYEKRSEFKVQLKLVPSHESETEIVWDELGYILSTSAQTKVFYSVKCNKGDIISIDSTTENKTDFHVLDSENFTAMNSGLSYQSSISESNSNSFRLDFKCTKTDTWYVVAYKKPNEYMKIETMIKLTKVKQNS